MKNILFYFKELLIPKLMLIIFCVLAALFLFFNFSYSLEEKQNVLFISSYNINYESVQHQIEGIKSVLNQNNIHFDVEFMDTKKISSDEYIKKYHDILKYKLLNVKPYDAIIVGDDNALQFAMDYQDELFKGIPVIFLGINDLHRAETANRDYNMTGIIESSSIRGNIKIAKEFNRNAKKVVAIVDNTYTGIGYKEQFYNLKDEFGDLSFDDINVSEYSKEELAEIFDKIQNDTILIYISMLENKNGGFNTSDEIIELLSRHTNVPVYCISSEGIGKGLLGGEMADNNQVGKIAANMALKASKGISISNIGMIYESPKKYVFDFDIIKKFNIDKSPIPENAFFINRNISDFEKHKELILMTLLFIVFLIILSTVLLLDSLSRRKIEKALKESNKKLEEIAESDYLTGLPNRYRFMKHLKDEINAGNEGTVILLDIDNFKGINDTLGHEYGDNIIKELASRFSNIEDKNIFVSRFGGDEFLILLSNIDKSRDIIDYIHKIKNIFASKIVVDGVDNFIKCTMGISRFPYDSSNADELISYADTAMYKAKHLGKNNYIYYNDLMKQDLKSKIEIEVILREALLSDGFKLLYQPIVSVKTGEIAGFEALLRLKNYDIPPNMFIPVAEDTDLILEIGRWVTKETVEQLARWRSEGFTPKVVSLNFSSKQLKDISYFEFLNGTLMVNNVDPNYLEIEFTESILLEKTESFLEFLDKLKKMGIKMALDDFGTGFSSLHYLTYIPVNRIKLDKSLCSKFLELDNINVIENIISLAHSLKLKITAEGIEKPGQYYSLKEVECDYIQGYLFSKPLETSEIEKIYDENLLNRLESKINQN